MPESSISHATRTQAIARQRESLAQRWEADWHHMIDQWSASGPDALWLMYSANYLMRTAQVRWAVDPVTLRNKVRDAAKVDVSALAELSFVLQTHAHSDHVDMALLTKLADMPIRWVVPDHMARVAREAGVPSSRVITAEPMCPIVIDGITITPFDGLHWVYADAWGIGRPCGGIASTGYLIEWDNHRLLLPGDTRTYQADLLPRFGPVNTLLAHIWLGRGAGLHPEPPLTQAMCDFLVDLQPTRRVVLAHLWQVARKADDYWDQSHAQLIQQRLKDQLSDVDIDIPTFWDTLRL